MARLRERGEVGVVQQSSLRVRKTLTLVVCVCARACMCALISLLPLATNWEEGGCQVVVHFPVDALRYLCSHWNEEQMGAPKVMGKDEAEGQTTAHRLSSPLLPPFQSSIPCREGQMQCASMEVCTWVRLGEDSAVAHGCDALPVRQRQEAFWGSLAR